MNRKYSEINLLITQREKKRAYRKKHYQQHREEEIERAMMWKRKHPIRVKEIQRRRYLKRKVELSNINQNKNMNGKKEITKEKLQFVVDNYGIMPTEEIAKKLAIPERKVKSWASILRRSGVDIKRARGWKCSVIREFVAEYLEKYPERKTEATVNLERVVSHKKMRKYEKVSS